MPIQRFIEWKLTCDTCFDSTVYRNVDDDQRKTIAFLRKLYGWKMSNGVIICEECQEKIKQAKLQQDEKPTR